MCNVMNYKYLSLHMLYKEATERYTLFKDVLQAVPKQIYLQGRRSRRSIF